jgi:hypothetical protein
MHAFRRTVLRILIASALLLPGGCRESTSLSPADVLSVRLESAHYVYLLSAGDDVDEAWQETYHEWLVGQLGVAPEEKIEYRKYRDRAHLRAVTGRTTNGFAEPGTMRMHTIWPIDNHEVVHTIVVTTLGHPPALFNEGIAVAHHMNPSAGILQPRWNGRSLDEIAAEHLVSGRLPALDRLLESRRFFEHDPEMMYPVSGSFVRYLIDEHGWPAMKTYLNGRDFDDSAAATRAAFLAAYGFSVDQAWTEWRASIEG